MNFVVASEDHSQNDCLVVFVLSHGQSNQLHAYDVTYKPASLWSMFTANQCSTLAGKPKMFFIQVSFGLCPRLLFLSKVSNEWWWLMTINDFIIIYRHVEGNNMMTEPNWSTSRLAPKLMALPVLRMMAVTVFPTRLIFLQCSAHLKVGIRSVFVWSLFSD